MTGMQDLHIHTTYCDGTLSPEEMIREAVLRGGKSIGFSEHAYIEFDPHYSMSRDSTLRYVSEVSALKEKYKDEIEVFLGLELDYHSDPPPEGLDYTIGTSHYLIKDGNVFSVDAGSKRQQEIADTFYGGDYYALAEDYFAKLSGIIHKTNANIAGHFDLVTKYNFDGSKFDETHPRYVSAAINAMDEILKKCSIFEVNTGAMYRQGKSMQYPSTFLLTELCKRGGEVLLSSDSHTSGSLYYKFDEMYELLRTCGFKYIKHLTGDGFVDVRLQGGGL